MGLPIRYARFLSEQERRRILDGVVRQYLAAGWVVQSATSTSATLKARNDVNHGMHLAITIIGGALTCGVLAVLWPIAWIMDVLAKTAQISVWVDEFGQVGRSG